MKKKLGSGVKVWVSRKKTMGSWMSGEKREVGSVRKKKNNSDLINLFPY